MVGGIPLHPAGNIVSEVIGQTTDDARDRGQVTGGQAADIKHNVILHHLGPAARPPVAATVVASHVGVQAYEWFGLRDGRTTATWSALGVLRDDYTRKPAFATLQHLIANQAART